MVALCTPTCRPAGRSAPADRRPAGSPTPPKGMVHVASWATASVSLTTARCRGHAGSHDRIKDVEGDPTSRQACLGGTMVDVQAVVARRLRPSFFSSSTMARVVRSTVSGERLIESIPIPDQILRNLRIVGRRLAADARVTAVPPGALHRKLQHFSTAGSRSSNSNATIAESRSTPSMSWVRSLEPIEKPSNSSAN